MDISRRKKIGILLVNDDVGVAYYLANIVKSLGFLEDGEQPEILLLYSADCKKYIHVFEYKYLISEEIEYNSNKKLKYLISVILRKNVFIENIKDSYQLDGLFPLMDLPLRSKGLSFKIASWIPDFQHKFYPGFFTKTNLVLREARFKKIIANCDAVVLSSNDAYSHLKQFYKFDAAKTRIQVMPFVSLIKNSIVTDYKTLVEKYDISTPFFLVSNQFYAHKNHMVILKAIKQLKSQGLKFAVYLTGKTEDYRNPLFYGTLLKFIEDNNLQNEAKILGMIPREDQLGLLKKSLAIIQPSKFEGWSTIIEDAKTLQGQIICSGIDVHHEQMGDKAFYFDADNDDELAKIMKEFLTNDKFSKPVFDNYEERVRKFASTFSEIFD